MNVRNKVKDKNGNWVDQTKKEETINSRSGFSVNVAPDTDFIIFDISDKKVILETLEIGTNDSGLYPVLYYDDSGSSAFTNELLHLVGTGSTRSYASLNNLTNDARVSSYMEVNYTSSTGGGNMKLSKDIILPKGGKLIIRTSNSDTKMTYKAVWREIEE